MDKILREFRDQGYGITAKSLQYWKKNRNKVGRVVQVECNREPLVKKVDRKSLGPGLDNATLEWNLRITGTKARILLSGCNCGYGGEGPHGTMKILTEVGIAYSEAKKLILQSQFSVYIPACYCCQNYGIIDGGDLVPYGSTSVKTPEYYGCTDWLDWDNEKDETLDSESLSKCPNVKETSWCKVHPTERIDRDGICPKCIEGNPEWEQYS